MYEQIRSFINSTACAVFHHLVGPTGKVVGVDHIDKLVELSEYNLKNDGLGDMLDSGAIKMVTGDGRQGYADSGECLIGTKEFVEEFQDRMMLYMLALQHHLCQPHSYNSSPNQVVCSSLWRRNLEMASRSGR